MASDAYDVFISHSVADRTWVEEWLYPRLTQAGLRVAVDYQHFDIGVPRLQNIERFIGSARHTIAVLSPDWTASESNAFELLLTRDLDPAMRRRKLLPILLKPCQPPDCRLPDVVPTLTYADFTTRRRWEDETQRLIRALRQRIPPPAPAAAPQLAQMDWLRWWLRYYRMRLAGAVGAMIALLLTLSALIGWPRFAGWQALGRPMSEAWRLQRAGEVLLVSTSTSTNDCAAVGTALWRSTDGGASWRTPAVAQLRYQPPSGACFPAAMADFAHAPTAPQVIYAATTNVGLLHSAEGGASWERMNGVGLPDELTYVTVSPADPQRLFASGTRGGLFHSTDAGQHWVRLDAPGACATPDGPISSLPSGFQVGVLLATANAVYAGDYLSGDKVGIYPSKTAGLYRSRDGGACWARLDGAEERYGYVALAEGSGAKGQLLVITHDYRAEDTGRPYQLWLVQGEQGRARLLWESCHTTRVLYVTNSMPPIWYVADDIGEVFYGSLEAAVSQRGLSCGGLSALRTAVEGAAALPHVTRCILPTALCLADLTPDFQPGAPLLLMGDRVYRLGQVSWPQAVWP